MLEGIIAVQHTDKSGTRITAGGSYLGGFACEYAGNGSVEEAEANLREAMQQLFARRYQTRFCKLEIGKSVVRTYTPERSFGTILVGIGFASYLVPVLKPAVEVTPSHKDKSHVKYADQMSKPVSSFLFRTPDSTQGAFCVYCRQTRSYPETGFGEIAPTVPFAPYPFSKDLPEADFWPRNAFPSRSCSCKRELDGANGFTFEEFGVGGDTESFQQAGLYLP